MPLLYLFVAFLVGSMALGVCLWFASQGSRATSPFGRPIPELWAVFAILVAWRWGWAMLIDPGYTGQAIAMSWAGPCVAAVLTICFWIGHWRAGWRSAR
ncbi:MAG: hypothetical protein AAF559_04170 [Pseudomonadota bacterium]